VDHNSLVVDDSKNITQAVNDKSMTKENSSTNSNNSNITVIEVDTKTIT
jgi:hypothetical protein